MEKSKIDNNLLARLSGILPKVPGINGREDYLCSAVLVLLTKIEGKYHLLFEKRSSKIRQGGEICFPGGKFDERVDKTTADTALRETEEETGLPADQITLVGPLDYIVAPMGAIVEPYLGLTDDLNIEKLKFSADEVESIFVLPVDFFKHHLPEVYQVQVKVHPTAIDEKGRQVVLFPSEELGLGEDYTKPWGRGKNTLLVYKTEKGIIWGLTAKIIADLVKRIDLLGFNE